MKLAMLARMSNVTTGRQRRDERNPVGNRKRRSVPRLKEIAHIFTHSTRARSAAWNRVGITNAT
jgi:hypothetical protein